MPQPLKGFLPYHFPNSCYHTNYEALWNAWGVELQTLLLKLMSDSPPVDPFLTQLCTGYTEAEVAEIELYLAEWDASTYINTAQSILDHAARKEFSPLKYLRKAHNFNKKKAVRVPKSGYRSDGSAVYRKGNEYLIIRPDRFGVEKIVTYGVSDD